MSYILEALKKSERDRALGQVPGISSEAVAPSHSRPVTRWALGAIMVLIGLSGGLLLARFETGTTSPGPATAVPPTADLRAPVQPGSSAASPSASPAQPATPAAPAPPAPHEGATPRAVAPPRQSPSPAVEQAHTPASSLSGATANAPSATPPSSPPPAAVSAPKGNAPPLSASGAAEANATDQATPAVPAGSRTPAEASPTGPAPPASAPAKVPLLQDLPADVRQGMPALHIDVHVYDKDPARRFVLINMHRYREGDTLAAGPRLLRITQGGVVLEYHGVRFRLGSD